ncbi:MAG: enoyl-CoA hydratase/isomerase family protein [Chromatiales bacterium]|jgi:enoyl-CoA hydratase/carnithine racemase|nr:enoyl-CoA hydratase/isomerase family protein [Chromatiales bacterium]
MKTMDYQHIQVTRDGDIATVTFNRPSKANALNPRHIEEIEHAALSFRDDDQTRVVIFTGAGKHFCSGADLKEREPAGESLIHDRRRRRIGERCIQALLGMDQITIAAWRGGAMGGGAAIATALDFRVAADTCFLSYPEILIGVNLMWQSLPLAVHLVGPARAKRLVISGEHVHGPTLLEWGLLDEMVATDQVMIKALEWATLYASRPPVAAQMIKRSVNAISSALDGAVMHMDFDQHLLAARTDDAREAASAYLERRDPTFTGR